MGKRKRLTFQPNKSNSRVEIVVEDLSSHPRCLHGPTLLFSGERGDFYACASCRGRECRVRITREDWSDPRVREKNNKFEKLTTQLDKEEAWKTYQKVKYVQPIDRAYCIQCDSLHRPSLEATHATHRVVAPLCDRLLQCPSSWLPPLENDSVEAQYLFSEQAIKTIMRIVTMNNIGNVLCIGTPSIHEAVQQSGELKSLLLDYDNRHHRFWPPDKFIWYNMFNHHFFDGSDDEMRFEQFLESSRDTGLCIVMDPPFGGRVEPIAHTLCTITQRYNAVVCAPKHSPIPVIWAFPYFSEQYIVNLLPQLKMHDYQVEYTNHSKFKRSTKPNKLGSPVRLFTNLPHNTVDLSHDSGYRLCVRCDKWVSQSNRHCDECGACTSKNGATYEHCDACGRCVKPTFFHCVPCGRCCQREGHVCGVVVRVQSCYNCKEKGHKKVDCPQLKLNKTHHEMNAKKCKKKHK